MKRTAALFLCLCLVFSSMAACGADESDQAKKIVTASSVAVEWINTILGEENSEFSVILLADKGKDMHNFQPSAADVKEIAEASLVVYIGGESDNWINGAVKSVGGNAALLRLMDEICAESAEDCLEHHGEEGHSHGGEGDEHIWLSFENSKTCLTAILEEISLLDPNNAEVYKNNCDAYLAELDGLEAEYIKAVADAEYKTLVFADRFPFVYLMNELGLEYYAAFPGCSSETTASFETIVTLSEAVDSMGLPGVIVIADSTDSIAKTVLENCKNGAAEIFVIDSMQVYKGEGETDFLGTMRQNLDVLKKALGVE